MDSTFIVIFIDSEKITKTKLSDLDVLDNE